MFGGISGEEQFLDFGAKFHSKSEIKCMILTKIPEKNLLENFLQPLNDGNSFGSNVFGAFFVISDFLQTLPT